MCISICMYVVVFLFRLVHLAVYVSMYIYMYADTYLLLFIHLLDHMCIYTLKCTNGTISKGPQLQTAHIAARKSTRKVSDGPPGPAGARFSRTGSPDIGFLVRET